MDIKAMNIKAMDIKATAKQIKGFINDTTIFDGDRIKKMLKLMVIEKPNYNSYEFLGLGGQGLLLKVNGIIALKIVRLNNDNNEELDRMKEEMELHQQFTYCSYIIKVNDNYFLKKKDEKRFYVIEMELCNGDLMQFLSHIRKNNLPFNNAQKDRLAIQALDALNFLHQKGICHRDIKPQNFLFKKANNGEIVLKLTDFGCAKIGKHAKNTTTKVLRKTTIKGTECYMPYEVLQNRFYTQSDLFSLGLVLLQIDNIEFDYQQTQPIELQEVQNELYQDPFQNHKEIRRDSLIYNISKTFLKKNPKQRTSAKEALLELLKSQIQYNQNSDLQIYSISKKQELESLVHQSKLLGKYAETISQFILKEGIYDEFEILGEGAFGFVIGAKNTSRQNQAIALKIQKVDSQSTYKQIQQEIETIMMFNSPYIIKIYSYKYLSEFSLIEMERCDFTLSNYLKMRRLDDSLDEQTKIDIAIQVIDALNCLHSKNILHRDIKPDNILLSINNDARVQAKIADFGLARKILSLEEAVSVKGTPCYWAPEVLKLQQFIKEADIFSLGISILELDNYKTFVYDYKQMLSLHQSYEIPFNDENGIKRHGLLYQIAESLLKYQFKERISLSDALKLLSVNNKTQIQLLSRILPINKWEITLKQIVTYVQDTQQANKIFKALEKEQNNYIKNSTLEIKFDQDFIGDKGAIGLGQCLKSCTALTTLHLGLNSNYIADKGAIGLGKCLKSFTALTTLQLSLSYNKIAEQGAIGLGECLKSCTALTTLHIGLSHNEIAEQGAIGLGECLKSFTALTTLQLILYSNRIAEQGAIGLGECLKSCTALTTLHLGLISNQIAENGAIGLGKCLKSCTALTTLHLGLNSNQIADKGAIGLGECLKSCTALTTLHIGLNSNYIADKGAIGLGECLKSCTALTTLHLDLSSNQIAEQGAIGLGEFLKSFTAMTTLHIGLNSNQIADKGAIGLGECLKSCTALTTLHLDLSSNQIGDKGAIGFGEYLKSCTALTTLHLGLNSNYIADKGAIGLGKCLKSFTALTTLQLSLSYNKIAEQGAIGLGECLKSFTALTTLHLDLSYNKIADNSVIELREYLKSCTALTTLQLNQYSKKIAVLTY